MWFQRCVRGEPTDSRNGANSYTHTHTHTHTHKPHTHTHTHTNQNLRCLPFCWSRLRLASEKFQRYEQEKGDFFFSFLLLLLSLFFFGLFRAAFVAYGSSQARGLIEAATATQGPRRVFNL